MYCIYLIYLNNLCLLDHNQTRSCSKFGLISYKYLTASLIFIRPTTPKPLINYFGLLFRSDFCSKATNFYYVIFVGHPGQLFIRSITFLTELSLFGFGDYNYYCSVFTNFSSYLNSEVHA